MAFTPTSSQLGGSFVQDLSGFQQATSDISSFFTEKNRQKSIKSGVAEGALSVDVDDPSLPERRGTFRASDKAFNASSLQAYQASVQNDMLENVSRIQDENPDNPEAFQAAIEGYKAGLLSEVADEIRPQTIQLLDKLETKARINVQSKQRANAIAENSAIELDTYNTFKNELFRTARAGEELDGDVEALGLRLDDMADRGLLTHAAAAKEKRYVRRETKEQELKSLLDQSTDLDDAFNTLEEIKGMKHEAWSPDQWDTFIKGQTADLTRRRSQEVAIVQQDTREAAAALKDYGEKIGLGFPVEPEEKARMVEMIDGVPELEERFQLIEDVQAFSLSSRNDRETMLDALQTGESKNFSLFKAASVANAKINKMVADDGYMMGVNQGLIVHQPFDPSFPETLTRRIDQVEGLSAHYGSAVSPLTSSEVQGLVTGLEGMTVVEKIALATTLEQAPSIWGQIDSKGGSTYAMAGATGDVTLMGEVFTGQDLINQKLAVKIKPGDYLNDYADITGGVYGSDDSRSLLNAAIAHYAATADRSGEYDAGAFENSVQAVSGGIGDINGFKVELPRGVDEDVFDDFIGDMQPETISLMGGVAGLTDADAAEFVRRGRLRSVKSGQYTVDLNGGTMMSNDGGPFVIEWNEEINALNESSIPLGINPRGRQ